MHTQICLSCKHRNMKGQGQEWEGGWGIDGICEKTCTVNKQGIQGYFKSVFHDFNEVYFKKQKKVS